MIFFFNFFGTVFGLRYNYSNGLSSEWKVFCRSQLFCACTTPSVGRGLDVNQNHFLPTAFRVFTCKPFAVGGYILVKCLVLFILVFLDLVHVHYTRFSRIRQEYNFSYSLVENIDLKIFVLASKNAKIKWPGF